jgi:hypothetical protein
MPNIVSPAHDGPVPPKFDVEWTGGYLSLGNVPRHKWTMTGEKQGRIEVKLPIDPFYFDFPATLATARTEVLRLGEIDSITPNSANQLSLNLIRESRAIRRVTVVAPEPSTLTMASLALLSLAALRRRK